MSSGSKPRSSADSPRALLSVSERTGIVELARALVEMGFELLSTGGTAAHLATAGLPVTPVSEVGGFPEVFGGRVKTLQPRLFGGILFDRDAERDRQEAAEHGIRPIDLVAVNLYPFEETLAKGEGFAELVEKIDVGGPSLLRAAAKNHAHVTVLCDPADYPAAVEELYAQGTVSMATRRRLAAKVFRRTAAYDALIARWLSAEAGERPFAERWTPTFTLSGLLRYGENPHQEAAFYVDPGARRSAFARHVVLQGKELSHNNLLDADAALFAARALCDEAPASGRERPTLAGLAIVKHRIPCGMAIAANATDAFERAWESDPMAGFGGVVACTGTLDARTAQAMTSRFLEVVVAYDVTAEAREVFAGKPNLRVLQVAAEEQSFLRLEARGVDGGMLVQEADVLLDEETLFRCVTRRPPGEAEARGLAFAWRAVRGVVSNAIVVTDESATLGIGGGRTSRVDACRDAVTKAGERARGAVAGSDAFFPFPDGLEVLADAGVTAVVQPGGSVRDADVIAAADARGMAMLFTSCRHFRH